MELFAADGHDAGGCERVTGKSGMRPLDAQLVGAGDARVRGFLATRADGGLADYDDPGAVVTFASAAEQAARGVDGSLPAGKTNAHG